MSKNVAVFVDVANIFYAAKAAGVDIDYVTLLKSASAGRDLVRAYAYTGLDPDNENQRNFHSFLARHGYRVVSKDIRKYGDGKVKANLDIELVVDMMKTARNLDIAIVVSGDGDFAPAIRAVQEMGVRVEVISFRGNTSSDLIEVADQFTDITALAKVEKGSSRSGRRVAEADEDLSMTEVPDKQTEGVGGDRRGRGGRGRGGRGRREELEPTARIRRPVGEPAAVTSSGAPLVVLPGERLSRVAAAGGPSPIGVAAPGDDLDDELEDPESGGAVAAFGGALSSPSLVAEADEEADGVAVDVPDPEADGEVGGDAGEAEERRRRRRRGGRGRGRGRGRGEAGEAGDALPAVDRPQPVVAAGDEDEYEEPVIAPRGPRTTPFGSVWDSQLGVPSMPAAPAASGVGPLGDDDDFEEPEIPEYLIAERRNQGRSRPGQAQGGQRGGRGGPRGGRSAYAAAMERERYGGGRGSGGLNRYPDVSARERPAEPRREERFARPAGGPPAGGPRRGGGDEPWSEVPPELEAMLRAQLGTRPSEPRPRPTPASFEDRQPVPATTEEAPLEADAATAPPEATDAAPVVAPARRGRRPAAASAAGAAEPQAAVSDDAASVPAGDQAATGAPKRRTTRRSAAAVPEAVASTDAAPSVDGDEAPAPAARRRAPRRTAASAASDPGTETAEAVGGADAEVEAPKRRTTRRKAATADTADAAGAATPAEGAPGDAPSEAAPKRRATRRRVGEESPGG